MTIETIITRSSAAMAGRPDRSGRIAALAATASIEISPRDDPVREGLPELLPPGATVFVNHPGSSTHHDIVAACVKLRRAGFLPQPHIAARRLASFTQLRDFLQRAAGEAGVTRIFVIAGDPGQAAGPFRDSLDLLGTGLIERTGIGHVAFAGYPEGHPRIDRASLDAALRAKLAAARQRGLDAGLVTQFGFDAAAIARWIASLREDGVLCPIRVGLAGPATIATLAKFAVRCGVGASLRALGRGQTAFARILREATPDTVLETLMALEQPATPIDALHLFTFGGVAHTLRWLQARRGPPIALSWEPMRTTAELEERQR
jgi:methylenetetrahydrofolate reductase (NADPH)